MGSYCSLLIDDYEIGSSKSYINPFLALIFRETDYRSRMVKYDKYYTHPLEEGEENVPNNEYAITVDVLKDRLHLIGFSLDLVKEEFLKGIKDAISDDTQFLIEDSTEPATENISQLGILLTRRSPDTH